ncbi:MAG TPA: AtpZ/AtpI family protein [Geobacteraceae bacterium]|nr:AtpZ/AtpI family protein [Geobacteraceae bacterium]
MEKRKLTSEVEKAADELSRSRREKKFWHYASLIGVGGWLFVLPVVAGAYLGNFLDRKSHVGISWTITCILLGFAFGIYNVWEYYIRRPGK